MADACDCGWKLPTGVQLLIGGLDRVLVSCGECGCWWQLETSIKGGWRRDEGAFKRPTIEELDGSGLRRVTER